MWTSSAAPGEHKPKIKVKTLKKEQTVMKFFSKKRTKVQSISNWPSVPKDTNDSSSFRLRSSARLH